MAAVIAGADVIRVMRAMATERRVVFKFGATIFCVLPIYEVVAISILTVSFLLLWRGTLQRSTNNHYIVVKSLSERISETASFPHLDRGLRKGGDVGG